MDFEKLLKNEDGEIVIEISQEDEEKRIENDVTDIKNSADYKKVKEWAQKLFEDDEDEFNKFMYNLNDDLFRYVKLDRTESFKREALPFYILSDSHNLI